MVTTEVAPDDAARYGIVQVDGDTVTDYAYKPDEPATTTATNEVFVFSPEPTLDRLEALAGRRRGGRARRPRQPAAPRPDPRRPRPRPPAGGLLAGRRHDPGVLGGAPGLPVVRAADRPGRPRVAGAHPRRAAQRRAHPRRRGGRRQPGLGRHPDRRVVRGSVLSPGVVVEQGATVVDSVLLPGVRVRAGRRHPGGPGRPGRGRGGRPRSAATATSPSSVAARGWPGTRGAGGGAGSPIPTGRQLIELHPDAAAVAPAAHLRHGRDPAALLGGRDVVHHRDLGLAHGLLRRRTPPSSTGGTPVLPASGVGRARRTGCPAAGSRSPGRRRRGAAGAAPRPPRRRRSELEREEVVAGPQQGEVEQRGDQEQRADDDHRGRGRPAGPAARRRSARRP